MKKDIRLAYSPDSDDLFMFYAVLENKIDCGNYNFICHTDDTENLNDAAFYKDDIDVTAISVHSYAYISERYLLLPHGGSVGMNYGPVLISKEAMHIDEIKDKKIAVPGQKTTAYLVLKLIEKKFNEEVIPISPFQKVFEAIDNNEVDAGLVIHEGRLTYEKHGYHKIIDIGEWWYENFHMPLPLGANVINRRLGRQIITDVSSILKQSIRYSLDNKDEVIDFLIKNDPRKEKFLKDKALLNNYLNMYANEQTYDYGEEGRKAIQFLLDQGYYKGIIPHLTHVEFSE